MIVLLASAGAEFVAVSACSRAIDNSSQPRVNVSNLVICIRIVVNLFPASV